MSQEFPFEINIPRPHPGTNENETIIKYIEPLREAGLVAVSSAYWYNLDQYERGEECSLSPGFKYMFWFKTEPDMIKFKQHLEAK